MQTFLTDFSVQRPRYVTAQAESLEWIVKAHGGRVAKLVERCACDPTQIGFRGHVVPPDRIPNGMGERSALFEQIVRAYFEAEYARVPTPPSDVVHVTCTGYASPSPAQHLVQSRGWGSTTRVTHAYHMGCYAAFPAIRMGLGFLRAPELRRPTRRVDIVHTELCTLHFDGTSHTPEQIVVQSLFADGFVRYSIKDEGGGLRVLALDERVVPESEHCMRWTLAESGMQMTLSRDVPQRIAGELRNFVGVLYARAGLDARCDLQSSLCAIHPGGPRILDLVQDGLHLEEPQLDASRAVLFDHGNMSSATLPHIWARLMTAPRGTLVLSLAFGPGLTICGGLFRRE